MLQPTSERCHQGEALQGGDMSMRTLRPVGWKTNSAGERLSITNSPGKSYSQGNQMRRSEGRARSGHGRSRNAMLMANPSSASKDPDAVFSKESVKVHSVTKSGLLCGTSSDIPVSIALRQNMAGLEPKVSTKVQAKAEAASPEVNRRVARRHARLIDGIMFTVKHRRGRSSTMTERPSEMAGAGDSDRRFLPRLSWQKDQTLRRSWIHGVRSIFRPDNQSKQIEDIRHAHSRESSSRYTTTMSAYNDQSASHGAASVSRQRHPRFGLDGAFDDRSPTSTSSSTFNKPLPMSPDDIVRSLSSRTDTPSLSHATRPSTASTTSSGVTQASHQHDFRSIAQELLARHELSPVREMSNNNDSRDCEPAKIFDPPPS